MISRINRNRQQIIRTVVVFMILRAFYGISVMSIAFFLGWDLQNIREFEIFGFRVYLFIIFIVIILIIRRLYRIYGWFRKDTDG